MRLLRPLRTKAIALLWGGLSMSAVGDQLGMVAITWIAIGSLGAGAGYLTALQAGLTLITALLVGRWTDGRNERLLMIGADVARAALLVAIVMLWLAIGHVPATALIGLIAILAAGQAIFRPSVQAIMPALSPSPAMLPAVNALLDSTERLARLCGPGLIALTAAWIPTEHFLTLDAVSFVVSAVSLLAIGQQATQSRRPDGPVLDTLLHGFRALWRLRLLRYLLKTCGLNNGCWYAAMFLGTPLLLARRGGGVAAFGAVIMCYGISNFGGNLLIGSRPPARRPGALILWGNVINGLGMGLIGLSAVVPSCPAWGVLVGAVIAGAGGPMNDITRTSLMQTALPPQDVTAAFRAWMVAANGGILVLMLLSPTLFALTGPAWGVVLLGAGIAAGGLGGLALRADSDPALSV